MENNFRIRICSDVDFEEMVADLIWDNKEVATVIQEKGVDKMEVIIYPPPKDSISWNFPFNDLVKALNEAKERLLKMQKIDM